MTDHLPSKDKVRAFRDAVARFLTSASNPGRAAAVVHDNTPGSPYSDLVLAMMEIDAMLAGPSADEDAECYRWLRHFGNFALADSLLNRDDVHTLDHAIAIARASQPPRDEQ
jgi:hypothetical protein